MPDSSANKPTQAHETPQGDPLQAAGGLADLLGYELASWQDDRAEVTLLLDQRHMNRSGVMHGGVLSTLIDSACGFSGCYAPEGAERRRAFTLSLTCNFIGTAHKGTRITARARRSGGGKSVFFADCEVLDEAGRVIGSGQGTFKYITLRK
jgi:uncharacterized protein (TIGR00369 family)